MINFEMTVQIIELILILLGLLLVIFGWIIPYRQSVISTKNQQDFEKRLLCAKWEKELVDKQISDFYGPIAELLREQRLRVDLIIDNQLGGRRPVFSGGYENLSDWSENEQKVWIHYIDTYAIPIQSQVLKIIQNNIHLTYNSTPPECFKDFMEYILGLELLDNQKRAGVPNYYEYHYSKNYPGSFNLYIERTLTILLQRQNELLKICL